MKVTVSLEIDQARLGELAHTLVGMAGNVQLRIQPAGTDGPAVKAPKAKAPKERAEPRMYNKTCEGCGKAFKSGGARTKLCPSCEGMDKKAVEDRNERDRVC